MDSKYRARRFPPGDHCNILFEDSYKEFTEDACRLIDKYLEKYQREICDDMDAIYQFFIRRWLFCQAENEKAGYDRAPAEVEDYLLKATLGIIPVDYEYERSVGIYR